MKLKLISINKEQEKKFEDIKIEEIYDVEKCINAINLSNGNQVYFGGDSPHFIPLDSYFSIKGVSISGNLYTTPYELK